jgi:outer membrane protein OmpA-like peptidoglycan-associated protein
MKKSFLTVAAVVAIIFFGLTGCVTKKYVREQIDETQKQIEANQMEIASLKETSSEQNELVSKLSDTTVEALERAEEAGKVAEVKFLYDLLFTDESVHFGFDKSVLSKETKVALDGFAADLKTENKDVYIEIQGHTCNVGNQEYNMMLGLGRAEAVRWYLYTQHGLPLHRMHTISYGEFKPIADNSIRSNRGKNRRVEIVVME